MVKLRSIRKRKNMTMKELGKRVGVSEAAISYYELGKRGIKYEMLLKLGEALDCSVFDILGEDNQLVYLSTEEQALLDAWRKADKEDRFAVYANLRKYGMPKPVSEESRSSENLLTEEAG